MRAARLTCLLWLIFLCILNQASCTAADLTTNSSSSNFKICITFGLVSGIAAVIAVVMALVVLFIFWKQLDQKLQRIAELSILAGVFTSLIEQKRGLGNRRKELIQQLEETERDEEENKWKLQLVEQKIEESEKEKATDKTEGYLREKQHLLKAQWRLDKRKEQVEKQQLNLEKRLRKTEDRIIKIKERMGNHMELNDPQQEEEENQNDTAHLRREQTKS